MLWFFCVLYVVQLAAYSGRTVSVTFCRRYTSFFRAASFTASCTSTCLVIVVLDRFVRPPLLVFFSLIGEEFSLFTDVAFF